ncbi:MAG: transporter [Flavobacterium sp.]|nr:transporter [Flavobacterium sp.]
MNYKLQHILLILMCFSKSLAQQNEPIETDRPDQTETPAIVPKGMFQMENGFSFEKTNGDSESFLLPSALIKYGLNDRFEFRLITEFGSEKTNSTKISGINPILVGFKVGIAEEKGIWPKVSFISHLLLPDLASSKLKSTYYAPRFRFTMQHTLSDRISLGYNLGAEWDGETPDATFLYTLTTGFSLSKKMGCYVEVYGFAPQNDSADHRFDGGFTYLLSNNFMIDASGGFGITANAPDYYGAFGFSFRL